MASSTRSGVVSWYRARTWEWLCGDRTSAILPVRISLPPMMIGISTISFDWRSSSASSAVRSALPGS